jgi:nucleotide-binding universal stress UspA family protein
MRTPSIEPVVVGVDGTLASIGALDLAADEAMARVAPLVVVCTVEPPLDPGAPQHRRLLDLAVSRAAADHPGLAVSGELAEGDPLEALAAWSARACLLVVGPGQAAVAARSEIPVIVFRPFAVHTHAGRRPVLVTDDDRSAYAFASAEAALRGAPLVKTHANLVGASRDAALIVVDGTVGPAVIERAGCPVAVVG